MQNESKQADQVDLQTPVKRVGKIGLSLLNPFSDLFVIYRQGVQPSMAKLVQARALLRRDSTPAHSMSWEQAVAVTGKPIEHLRTTFKRVRAAWWFLMVASGGLSLILLLLVLAANFSLPYSTFARAVVTVLILAAMFTLSFAKTLVATFRLWQLQKRRVSESEGGTFKHFLAENPWFRQVLTLRNVD